MFRRMVEKLTTATGSLRGDIELECRRFGRRALIGFELTGDTELHQLYEAAQHAHGLVQSPATYPDAQLPALKQKLLDLRGVMNVVESKHSARDRISEIFASNYQPGQMARHTPEQLGMMIAELTRRGMTKDQLMPEVLASVRLAGIDIDAYWRETFCVAVFTVGDLLQRLAARNSAIARVGAGFWDEWVRILEPLKATGLDFALLYPRINLYRETGFPHDDPWAAITEVYNAELDRLAGVDRRSLPVPSSPDLAKAVAALSDAEAQAFRTLGHVSIVVQITMAEIAMHYPLLVEQVLRPAGMLPPAP